jgi:NADH dehydrogenase (ubiquinone) Fe-S protein 8
MQSSQRAAALASRQLLRAPTTRHLPLAGLTMTRYLAQQRRTYATPSGPPPKNFRVPPPTTWDKEKEGTFDKLGKYFLLYEMARGMWVLLEQFFRPP